MECLFESYYNDRIISRMYIWPIYIKKIDSIYYKWDIKNLYWVMILFKQSKKENNERVVLTPWTSYFSNWIAPFGQIESVDQWSIARPTKEGPMTVCATCLPPSSFQLESITWMAARAGYPTWGDVTAKASCSSSSSWPRCLNKISPSYADSPWTR